MREALRRGYDTVGLSHESKPQTQGSNRWMIHDDSLFTGKRWDNYAATDPYMGRSFATCWMPEPTQILQRAVGPQLFTSPLRFLDDLSISQIWIEGQRIYMDLL